MSGDPTEREHPTAEKLSAYQASELSSEEDDAIQEHLVSCSLCTERLLELQRFLEFTPETGGEVSDLETVAEWRRLREQLFGPALTSSSQEKERRNWRMILLPLAASCLLLAGLSWWLRGRAAGLQNQVADLREQVAQLRQPQANVPIRELESLRGGILEIPVDRTVDLDLRTSAPKDYAEYVVEIVARSGGESLWSSPLRRSDSGRLTFRLVGGFLEPGIYQIRLSGVQNGRRELLEEYLLRVRSE